MKLRYMTAMASAFVLGIAASAANAATVSYQFTSPQAVANFTLDVVGGQALDGTGTLSSPYWSGYENMTLVTWSTPGVNDAGGGHLSYRFGGGTDLIGDTLASTNPALGLVSDWGLVFKVDTPDQPTLMAGFNVWWNGGNSYTGFLAGNPPAPGQGIVYDSYNGTLSVVPLPAALPLFGAALAALGGFGWLGAKKQS